MAANADRQPTFADSETHGVFGAEVPNGITFGSGLGAFVAVAEALSNEPAQVAGE